MVVFPTAQCGRNETGRETGRSSITDFEYYFKKCPPPVLKVWKQILTTIIRKDREFKYRGEKLTITNQADIGRINHFIRFWEDIEGQSGYPDWMIPICIELKQLYGEGGRLRD